LLVERLTLYGSVSRVALRHAGATPLIRCGYSFACRDGCAGHARSRPLSTRRATVDLRRPWRREPPARVSLADSRLAPLVGSTNRLASRPAHEHPHRLHVGVL